MNSPATVDSPPMSTISSKLMMVYGIHDAKALPPTTSGHYREIQIGIQYPNVIPQAADEREPSHDAGPARRWHARSS